MKTMICIYTIKIVQIWDIVYLETQGMEKLSNSTPFPVTLISYPRLWKIFCSQFNQVQHNWFCIIDIDIFDDLDLCGDIDLWPKGLNFLKRDFQISIRFVKFLALFNYLMTFTFVVTLTFDLSSWNIDKVTQGCLVNLPAKEWSEFDRRSPRSSKTGRQTNSETQRYTEERWLSIL